MKIKIKKVYYCDYCKNKKGLSASAIRTHERHCTGNPKRICRMCGNKEGVSKEYIRYIRNAHKFLLSKYGKDDAEGGILGTHCARFEKKIIKLLDRLECPACTLAVIRVSKIECDYWSWDFKKAVEEYWDKKHDEDMRNEADYQLNYYDTN